MRTEILYKDGDILVVYKPAGFAVQTANVGCQDVVSELKNYVSKKDIGGMDIAKRDKGGMDVARKGMGGMDIARKDMGGMDPVKKDKGRRDVAENNILQAGRKSGHPGNVAPYLGIIHRLDQPVEGLLVFARNQKAAAALSAQLQRHEDIGFCKHYYAVLYGCSEAAEGRLEDYICKKGNRAEVVESQTGKIEEFRDPQKGNQTESVAKQSGKAETIARNGHRHKGDGRKMPKESLSGNGKPPEARSARLQYRILQTLDAQGIALADILLETGRFHQIRAQMAHGGMPLLGDLKYGGEESIHASQRLGIRNVALCAYRLEFCHPVTGRKMDFQIQPKGNAFSLFSQF